jgi:hypothetical protein
MGMRVPALKALSMKQRKSDILWKVVMEEVFDDLLRFIYPDADQLYDMERGFEFLEKELSEMYPEPDKGSDTRFADKLVKVFHRDGEEEWVLMHVEIQGDTSKRQEFTERMFRYFYRILDRYKRPVSAVVIFTGQDGKKMPCRFEYLYRQTRLVYEYQTFFILDFSDEELENSSNPFAQVVLVAKMALLEEKIPGQELLEKKIVIARKLLKKGFPIRKLRAIMKFLKNYVLFEEPEMNRIFTERIYSPKTDIMGIDEYIRWEAIEEEKERIVKNLLKGSDLSDEKIASLVEVTVEFVNEVKADLKVH